MASISINNNVPTLANTENTEDAEDTEDAEFNTLAGEATSNNTAETHADDDDDDDEQCDSVAITITVPNDPTTAAAMLENMRWHLCGYQRSLIRHHHAELVLVVAAMHTDEDI